MNFWQKTYGAKRAAIDRKLLASMEREIANEEKLRAKEKPYSQLDPAPCIDEEERRRIARAFGRPA